MATDLRRSDSSVRQRLARHFTELNTILYCFQPRIKNYISRGGIFGRIIRRINMTGQVRGLSQRIRGGSENRGLDVILSNFQSDMVRHIRGTEENTAEQRADEIG